MKHTFSVVQPQDTMTVLQNISELKRADLVTLQLEEQSVYCQVLCASENRVILNDSYSTELYHVWETENGRRIAYREELEDNTATHLGECELIV